MTNISAGLFTKNLMTVCLTAAALLTLASCGGRSLPASDGLVADGGQLPDRGHKDKGQKDRGQKKDACVPPKGCTSNSDCQPGFKCGGCHHNPCCPSCKACFTRCIPDQGCSSNKDCASTEYCELGPGCGKGAPGKCHERPQSCPKYLIPPVPVCGCDGKTYANSCEAHKGGTTVNHQGVCKPAGCAINKDCNKGQFCFIASGCKVTGAKMGDCKDQPNICTDLYSPVCGCDGKTFGNSCEAHSQGVNIAHKGGCNKTSCADLSKQYASELLKAKACCVTCSGPAAACAVKMPNTPACSCPTFVAAKNTTAIAALKALQGQWTANNCSMQMPCPPVSCKKLSKGVCGGFGAMGYCKDQ